jgi:DNA-binding MarR family transcriptional regulator
MSKKYDSLKLENNVCFPLYAAAREIMKRYRPFLDEIGITYTQFITLMVLWEENSISVKELGKRLYLDSGTLTPVLKSLEAKGLVRRFRSREDERVLIIEVTDEGKALRSSAVGIPEKVSCGVRLDAKESATLYSLLYKLLYNADN